MHTHASRITITASSLLVLALACAAPAHAFTFDGRAFGAMINLGGLAGGPSYFSDTGGVPTGGGAEGATVTSVGVPGVLSADVLVAATVAASYDDGPQSNGSTSLADVVVFPGTAAQLTTSFVRAQAVATADGLQGTSEIAGLTFGGMPIAVTGDPNQRVDIPGVATLIINEQNVASNASVQAITVNALHLILATGEEVVLSGASSSINW